MKAGQTCNFNFVICLPTWTYPSLPVLFFFIRLDLPPGASSYHLFIFLDLPLSASSKETSNPAQLGFGLFENFDLFENTFFLPEGLFGAFIGCMTLLTLHPYFRQDYIPDAMYYAMYDHE